MNWPAFHFSATSKVPLVVPANEMTSTKLPVILSAVKVLGKAPLMEDSFTTKSGNDCAIALKLVLNAAVAATATSVL